MTTNTNDMKDLDIIEIICMAYEMKDSIECIDIKFIQATMEEYIRRTGKIPGKVSIIPDAIILVRDIIKKTKNQKEALQAIVNVF